MSVIGLVANTGDGAEVDVAVLVVAKINRIPVYLLQQQIENNCFRCRLSMHIISKTNILSLACYILFATVNKLGTILRHFSLTSLSQEKFKE